MIYLREITKEDISIIHEFRQDKELVELLGASFRFINIETDELWFENYQKSRANNIRCAICLKADGLVVGTIYLLNINWIYRRAELGLIIGDKTKRGKGFGCKASELMIQHAFEDLNLNRIELKVIESNETAIHVYKKLGFIEEGLLRQSVYKNGEYINQIVMSLLREDFEHGNTSGQ